MSGGEYRHLGEEFLARAQRLQEPDLRLAYIRLAAGYGQLARFHDRVQSLLKAPRDHEAGLVNAARRGR